MTEPLDSSSGQTAGKTLEDKFVEYQQSWNNKIRQLTAKMKSLPDLLNLQPELYTARQDAVDHYYMMVRYLGRYNVVYKAEFAKRYKEYKMGNNVQIRFSSDSAIATQIEGDLVEKRMQITLIESQVKYMEDTIKTLDDLIYGLRNRIDIYKMINKVNF